MNIYERLGKKTAGVKAREIEKPADRAPVTGPGIHFSATARMHAAEQKAEELEEQLRNVKSAAKVALTRLHKIPGRQRTLSAEAYAELRENLRNNPMIEPVTVERRDDGDWNILSGHNRVDIYAELGRTEIDIFELEVAADRADVTAFYANLLHSPLSDYEKYLGIKKHMLQANLTQQEMANESGLSKTVISSLMAFDRLPAEAIAAISNNPKCLGSNAALKFAVLSDSGKSDLVSQAITELSTNNTLTQDAALKMVTSLKPASVAKQQLNISSSVFRRGRSKFAELKGIDKTLKISFSTEQDRIEIEAAIKELLEIKSKN